MVGAGFICTAFYLESVKKGEQMWSKTTGSILLPSPSKLC